MKFKYPYSDAHCDTITRLYKNNDSINNSKYMVNLSHLRKYQGALQVFAIYNNGHLLKDDVISIIEFLKNECRVYSEYMSLETKLKNTISNHMSDRITALLSIENLGAQRDFCIEDISFYNDNGIIMMSLCHNDNNILCGGIGENKSGLTPLGRRALRLMQKNGVILDVSHMSDISFWEALEEYSLPFTASHSNSRTVYPNMRNLTDKQFVCLVKRGGVCGINYYPDFLEGENSDIDSVIKHIEHFMSLGGENSICLGSDFDGIEKTAQNLDNAGCVYKLFDKLLSINYNESLVKKIAFGNFHNFLQKFETLK